MSTSCAAQPPAMTRLDMLSFLSDGPENRWTKTLFLGNMALFHGPGGPTPADDPFWREGPGESPLSTEDCPGLAAGSFPWPRFVCETFCVLPAFVGLGDLDLSLGPFVTGGPASGNFGVPLFPPSGEGGGSRVMTSTSSSHLPLPPLPRPRPFPFWFLPFAPGPPDQQSAAL